LSTTMSRRQVPSGLGRSKNPQGGHALGGAPAAGGEHLVARLGPLVPRRRLAPAGHAELEAELRAVVGAKVGVRRRQLHVRDRPLLALAVQVRVGHVGFGEVVVAHGGVGDGHLDRDVVDDGGRGLDAPRADAGRGEQRALAAPVDADARLEGVARLEALRVNPRLRRRHAR